MQDYSWIEKYSVGVKSIDEQHDRYFDLVNEIIKMNGQENVSNDEVMTKLKALNDYAIYHFTTEENIFKKYNYPETQEHTANHRAFEEKLDEFINATKKETGTKKVLLEIAQFAGSWLMNHIMNVDQKYAGFMKENGVN